MLVDKSASSSGIKNGNMSNKELTEELHKLFENLEKADSSFLNLNLKDNVSFLLYLNLILSFTLFGYLQIPFRY